jgi:broad specificity phosphatase PhoE
MEIFLVRHGETEGNVAHRHQAVATPLTQIGKQQITETAQILRELKPTHLLTSSVLRAVESAQIIGLSLDMIPETSEAFRELDRPLHLNGNFHKSLGSLWFYTLWYLGLTNHKKYGGESYKDLRNRIESAQAILAKYPDNAKVVVVSHSVFINFFLAHACDNRAMNPFQAVMRFCKVLSIKNGSVTKILYEPHPSAKVCDWQLIK